MRKQPELTETTHQHLKETVWNLLKERPIERITISQVTETANVHRSTFYRYYHDVYEVQEELEQETLQAISDHLSFIKEGNVTELPLTGLSGYLQQVLVNNAERVHFLKLRSVEGTFLKELKSIIARFLNEMVYGEFSDLEREFLLEHFSSVFLTNMEFFWQHPNEETLPTMIRITQRIMLEGLASAMIDIEKPTGPVSKR
ncbi:MAG: TetR/AcrR family transcriptional regulator [Clostridia bacterium]|nr:TetR/AcrR family transcriptional regulator [Clostridia bacterium]